MKVGAVIIIVGLALLLGVRIAVVAAATPSSPAEAMRLFDAQDDVAEEQLRDPLILAGTDVVPLIQARLNDKAWPRRRYALSALGDIGDPSSIDLLRAISIDTTEPKYVRCDALTSLAIIEHLNGLPRAAPPASTRSVCGLGKETPRRTRYHILLGDTGGGVLDRLLPVDQ